MELIRKKSKLTRMLILRELVIAGPKDQRSIAKSIGITPQAVSEYLKKMDDEGLVDIRSRPPRATIKGVDLLQNNLLQLKDLIDRSIDGLEIVRSTDAIAASRVSEGDRLRTFMHDGFLYCEPGDGSPSTGIADNSAEKDEIVMISGLSGVVEIPEAKLIIVEIEPARKGGGSIRINEEVMEKILKDRSMGSHLRIAVLDQEAASMIIRSGMEYDMELPGPQAVLETLERGVSVLCFGTPHSTSGILISRELSQDRSEKCRMRLRDIG